MCWGIHFSRRTFLLLPEHRYFGGLHTHHPVTSNGSGSFFGPRMSLWLDYGTFCLVDSCDTWTACRATLAAILNLYCCVLYNVVPWHAYIHKSVLVNIRRKIVHGQNVCTDDLHIDTPTDLTMVCGHARCSTLAVIIFC